MRRLTRQSAMQSMLLDGAQSETFVIDLNTSVDTLRVKNVSPGRLYVFVAMQSAVGNHRLNWGDRIRNGVSVDPDPNSITVQCFVGLTGGVLQAVPPGTWITPTTNGTPGPPGPVGPQGPAGLSAYEIAVQQGFIGTEQQWLLSLQGATGATGPAGPPAQIIQVADQATAIAQSAANPSNFYFWV